LSQTAAAPVMAAISNCANWNQRLHYLRRMMQLGLKVSHTAHVVATTFPDIRT
jgi:hypothetical protein